MRLVRVEVPEAEGEDGVANGADRAASAKQGHAGDGSGAGRAVPEGAALVVRRTLRSGQRVVHDGPVLVLGDVNPGAEVVAGGSVVVWGRLRGMVEAGRLFEESVVCALDLAPTQLRIGAAIARAPEEPGRVPVPEVAREGESGIIVDAWR
jgi:septum site-determining protein MinC